MLRERIDAWLCKGISSRKIFIIGTGRSGTHWLSQILDSHHQFFAIAERWPYFPWTVRMAIDNEEKRKLFPRMLLAYRIGHSLVAPRNFVDKSHPNIWLAEDLAANLPDALFLGIQRGVFATVSSMLKHSGVRRWCEDWEEYPVPNRFLGITEDNRSMYENLSLAGKCAVRWKVHERRLSRLQEGLGSRCMIIEYEYLAKEPDDALEKLADFLGVQKSFPMPRIKEESLEKWRGYLTGEDCSVIQSVLDSELF